MRHVFEGNINLLHQKHLF